MLGLCFAWDVCPCPRKDSFFVGSKPVPLDINTFHVAYGHLGQRSLRAAAEQQSLQLTNELQACEACLSAKMSRAAVSHQTTTKATTRLGTVHLDVADPYESSVGGSHYLVAFLDSMSLDGRVAPW